ncbi:MAG: hypothetical protein RL757_2798 [Bacteroidota bacterium]
MSETLHKFADSTPIETPKTSRKNDNFIFIRDFLLLFLGLGGIVALGLYWLSPQTFSNMRRFNATKFRSQPFLLGGERVEFGGKKFAIYVTDLKAENAGKLQLFLKDAQNQPLKNIGALKNMLDSQGKKVIFAMNAGMYRPDNMPQGLYLENRKLITPIDSATKGYGNFYLQPNGVFAFNDTAAAVLTTQQALQTRFPFKFATQSGPILVNNGQINPLFDPKSTSLHYRNGVGVNREGKLFFVMSQETVNFYLFSDFFKTYLNCQNALYLDGAISRMYAPEINLQQTDGDLGPLVAFVEDKIPNSGNFVFENKKYAVFVHQKQAKSELRLHLKDKNGKLIQNFQNLAQQLQTENRTLVAAMSGGSFDKNFMPEGLYVENKIFLKNLNERDGKGNFYLKPNGVFYTTKNDFNIVNTADFSLQQAVEFAQQSGPMLLENGNISPNFGAESNNLQIRNAVALLNNQTIAFVTSDEKVSFHELASFCQKIGAVSALCLDSGHSELFAPEIGRNNLQNKTNFSVIFSISQPK